MAGGTLRRSWSLFQKRNGLLWVGCLAVVLIVLLMVRVLHSSEAERTSTWASHLAYDGVGSTSSGAGSLVKAAERYDVSNGRSYWAVWPSTGCNSRTPLVVILHGPGMEAHKTLLQPSSLRTLMARSPAGMAVLLPEANDSERRWRLHTSDRAVDIDYVKECVKHFQQMCDYNPRRVVVVGFHTGGMLASALLGLAHETFTAGALINSGFMRDTLPSLPRTTPVALVRTATDNESEQLMAAALAALRNSGHRVLFLEDLSGSKDQVDPIALHFIL